MQFPEKQEHHESFLIPHLTGSLDGVYRLHHTNEVKHNANLMQPSEMKEIDINS